LLQIYIVGTAHHEAYFEISTAE